MKFQFNFAKYGVLPMPIIFDTKTYIPKGDKKNSDYFYEYLPKIYQRRSESGLDDLIGNITGILIQVNHQDLFAYLRELYLMTPYRLHQIMQNASHHIAILKNHYTPSPVLIVMEPNSSHYVDDFTRMNMLYPNALVKPNARYIGEIFHTRNLLETINILKSHDFSFFSANESNNELLLNENFILTRPSDISFNCIGYSQDNFYELESFPWGKPFQLNKHQKQVLQAADDCSREHGIEKLLLGIDHCATRVLANGREDAILEFLCLSNYYFWGAYNIEEMNSSTNVTRTPHGNDLLSPAKVFTANNTPYMVNSFENRPMPTEAFVKNYGRRMHHMAYEVLDGDHPSGMKNIDYVVQTLHQNQIPFLSQIFGECKDIPNLKQIFSKHSELSLLITEYVERCKKFDGFFTKDNVAELTAAAGIDEAMKDHTDQKGVLGD